MQEIIDDGSDHIKDLEEKIKNQGKGRNIIMMVCQNDKTKPMMAHKIWSISYWSLSFRIIEY